MLTFRSFSDDGVLRRHLHSAGIPAVSLCVVRRCILQLPARALTRCSDPNERAFFWVPTQSEAETPEWPELLDSPLTERQYIYTNEVLRVRVETEKFWDEEPGPPKAAAEGAPATENRRAPFVVTVRRASVSRQAAVAHARVAVLYCRARIGRARMVGWCRGGPMSPGTKQKCRMSFALIAWRTECVRTYPESSRPAERLLWQSQVLISTLMCPRETRASHVCVCKKVTGRHKRARHAGFAGSKFLDLSQ